MDITLCLSASFAAEMSNSSAVCLKAAGVFSRHEDINMNDKRLEEQIDVVNMDSGPTAIAVV